MNTTIKPGLAKPAGLLLIIEFFLIFGPLIILGSAINWPASLREPASVNLPLILEQYEAMMLGYGVYLVYSLLFWPVAYLVGRVIVGEGANSTIFQIANGFAALSALARVLGIVRWLFAMPVLARLYTDPAADQEMKTIIAVVYDMLNAYAGGVGELLGVNLFAAIWLVLISILLIREKKWPNWPAYFGLLSAMFLALNLLETVGVDMGPMISVSETIFHFWMLAMAIVFIRSGSREIRS